LYKILIVEDEELERTSMKIFLEENLLDVEIVGEAKSGFEADDRFKRYQSHAGRY
jgi:two-component system response regulator YesN